MASHPYFRRQDPPKPKHQRGSNRDMSLRLWASIYKRGGKRCVWHNQLLTASNHSIDHFDGNRNNNAASNLLPSCVGCNSKRGEEYENQEAANAAFDAYLREKGSSLAAALKRAQKQLSTPIPQGAPRYSPLHKGPVVSIWAPNDPEVDEIIREFLPGKTSNVDRLEQTRESGKIRSARSRAKRAEANQAHRQGPTPFDDDADPFGDE